MQTHERGEVAIRTCALSMGGAFAAAALSREPVVTAAAHVFAGAVWIMAWVATLGGWTITRRLSRASSGGIAMGSWGWGHVTDTAGVSVAFLSAAALLVASPLLGLWLPMPRVSARGEKGDMLEDPEVRLPLTERSGARVVEIEYRVARRNARSFRSLMQEVQLFRQRNGAYGWAIARDIADPELWTKQLSLPDMA
ncbi:MFS transporter [Bradyrhizobium sp. STM 3562]|uniref:MFS transporter n=1 Tax=Bradyrhizobium sp. STM 3562 TaxID=578924 RepID=UPI00388EA46F